MSRILDWFREFRRRNFPTITEQFNAGYQLAKEFEGDKEDLYDHAYGSSHPFDQGIIQCLRDELYE